MVRKITGLSIVFLLMAGLSRATEDKKDAKKPDFPWEYGTFVSYKDEILTLMVDKKEKEFKVPGDTPVGYSTGKKDDETKTLKAKVQLKDVKKGSIVTVTFDRQSKKVVAIGVIVSELPKDKSKEEEKKEK